MMTLTKTTRRLSLTLFALATLLALAPRPAAAQVQVIDLVVDSGPPGADLSVTGKLTNAGTTSVDLNNFSFSPGYGPASADLTSAIFFNSYEAPFTLAPSQTYDGTLFTLGTDPGASVGVYTKNNFAIAYGGDVVGQDFNITITSPNQVKAVPEPGTLVLALPALGLLALAARRRVVARP